MYMDNRRSDLSKYRRAQAEESLQAAKYCFEKKLYRDSLNRSYYAVFYSVKAVLSLEGIDFKRHKDAVGYFNQHYVKTEIFPKIISKKIGQATKIREDSDYDDEFIPSNERTEEQINTAREVIELVQKYLNENGGNQK